jgi:hypothetical protein
MDELPDPAPGFVRIQVRLPRALPGDGQPTPGDLARMSGVALDDLGLVQVLDGSAMVDVRTEHGKTAREHLERIGPTRLVGWDWQWLKLNIGRNHGLNIGQLKKVMLSVDALPLGRILINNTHTMVGVQDFKLPAVLTRMSTLRVNGYAARPEALPLGTGPGSAEYRGGSGGVGGSTTGSSVARKPRPRPER